MRYLAAALGLSLCLVGTAQADPPYGSSGLAVHGAGQYAPAVSICQYLASLTAIAGYSYPLLCDSSGRLVVNVGNTLANNMTEVGGSALALGQTTMSASLPVAIASNQSTLPANTAQVNGVTTLTGAGATGTGSQRVTAAQDTTTIAGSAPGTAGTASSNVVSVQGIASMTPIADTPTLGTTGGWTPGVQTALSTTVESIKSGAGQLGKMLCYNPNATIAYIQIFNIASGSVTLGTSVAVDVVPVPATLNGGFILPLPGEEFSTSISFAATTTPTGSTAPGSALTCAYAYN